MLGGKAAHRVVVHALDVNDHEQVFAVFKAAAGDLGPEGITAVTDPTGLFIENHHGRVAGTCVAVTMEGRRPMLAEVQALTATGFLGAAKRRAGGLDAARTIRHEGAPIPMKMKAPGRASSM
mgnify:CR=1 FL=1